MEVYTVQEVAKILKVCDATVRRMCADKRIGSFMQGNRYRIREEQLDEYMQRGHVTNESKR